MEASKKIDKWNSGKMLYEYDISKFIAKNDQKETIYHIPNELDIDYVGNKKGLLNQYKEIEIVYNFEESFHKVICSKFDCEQIHK